MRRETRAVLVAAILLPAMMGTSRAEEVAFYTRTFLREPGQPVEWVESVTVPSGIGAPFVLRVQNGLADGTRRVSSASVQLGSAELVRPNELNQTVAGLERPLELPSNPLQLMVRLTSPPGGELKLSLAGTRQCSDPAPELPINLRVHSALDTAETGTADVYWAPSPSPGVVHYRVYRGPARDRLELIGTHDAANIFEGHYGFSDPDYTLGLVAFYAVSAVNSCGIESAKTPPYVTLQNDTAVPRILPKFSGHLEDLYRMWEAGGDLQQAAKEVDVMVLDNPPRAEVAVLMLRTDPIPEADLESLRQLGVDLDEAYISDEDILVPLPLAAFPVLQTLDIVRFVDPQSRIRPMQSTATSGSFSLNSTLSGNAGSIKKLLGIEALHAKGIRGSGIKIAILDLFEEQGHGEIVREIVRIADPNAIIQDVPLDNAANTERLFFEKLEFYLKSSSATLPPGPFDVINMSLGLNTGSNAERLYKLFADHSKVLGVIAAGNEARQHSMISMEDTDQDPSDLVNFGSENFLQIGNVKNKDVKVEVYSPQKCVKDGLLVRLSGRLCGKKSDGTPKCEPLQGIGREELSTYEYPAESNDEFLRLEIHMDPLECLGNNGKGREIHIRVSGDEPVRAGSIRIDRLSTAEGCITGIAAAPNVLTVGASKADRLPAKDDAVAEYSCQGPAVVPAPLHKPEWAFGPSVVADFKPDLIAPGLFEQGAGGSADGTSFATAWVSGAAALLLQKYRAEDGNADLTPEQAAASVRQRLLDFAQLLAKSDTKPNYNSGYGRLFVGKALTAATNGENLFLIGPDGEVLAALDSGTFILDLAFDPLTGEVWYLDLIENRICHGLPYAGNPRHACGPPAPDGQVYNALGADPLSGVWGALWTEVSQSSIVPFQFVPPQQDPEFGTIPGHVDAGPVQVTGIVFNLLRADPFSGGMWGTGYWTPWPHQYVLWNSSRDSRTDVLSQLVSLAADPNDGSVWTHMGKGSDGYLSIVHMTAEGVVDLVRRFERSDTDFTTYDFSVDPETSEVWVTHDGRWVRYAHTDPNELVEVLSVSAELEQALCFGGARQGKLSELDASLWGIVFVGLQSRRCQALVKHFAADGTDLTPVEEGVLDLGRTSWARLETWTGAPDMTDRSVLDPAAEALFAGSAQEPVPLGQRCPEFRDIEQRALEAGLSTGQWLRRHPEERLDFFPHGPCAAQPAVALDPWKPRTE